MSSDFEDIVYVLNYRNVIWTELKTASPKFKKYLKEQFADLLENEYLHEWISSHLDHSEQRRVNFIIGGLHEFTNASQ